MFIGRKRELSSLNRLYESVLAKIGKAFFLRTVRMRSIFSEQGISADWN